MVGLVLPFLLVSFGVINGIFPTSGRDDYGFHFFDPRVWVPRAFYSIGFSPIAIIEGEDISTKPANWTGLDVKQGEEIPHVKGARLHGIRLRFALASGTFLVAANLVQWDLEGADLSDADLRGALLVEANLKGTDLTFSDLRGAVLTDADLRKSILQWADFRDASLGGITGPDLTDARLFGARLEGASLREAKGLT